MKRRTAAWRWLIVGTALSLATACGSDDEPTGSRSAPAGTIYFVGGSGKWSRIYRADAVAGEVERAVGEEARSFTVTADGVHLAYVRPALAQEVASEIAVTNVVDRSFTTAGDGVCPSFTADGDLLVRTLKVGDPGIVRVVTKEGRPLRTAASDETGCLAEISDGRYVSWDFSSAIHVVDGRTRRTLAALPGCTIGGVDVAPDRDRISYTAACSDDLSKSGLYVQRLDRGQGRLILQGQGFGSSWSPDGRWLVAALALDSTEIGFRAELHILRPDGTRLRTLSGPLPSYPVWTGTPS